MESGLQAVQAAGLVCLVAAIVGGGVKLLGSEIPQVTSVGRQVVLGLVGLALLVVPAVWAPRGQASPAAAVAPPAPAAASPTSVPSSPTALPATPAPPSPTALPARPAPPSPTGAGPTPTGPAPAPASGAVGVGGVWRDLLIPTNGSRISQDGSRFTFTGWGVLPNGDRYETTGTGTLTGQRVVTDYRARYASGFASTGSCSGTVSADGMLMNLTCNDSLLLTFSTSAARQ
jgi:hypothetical protein